MPKVNLNAPAPDFCLPNFGGDPVALDQFQSKKNVLLVFNRGFM